LYSLGDKQQHKSWFYVCLLLLVSLQLGKAVIKRFSMTLTTIFSATFGKIANCLYYALIICLTSVFISSILWGFLKYFVYNKFLEDSINFCIRYLNFYFTIFQKWKFPFWGRFQFKKISLYSVNHLETISCVTSPTW
jgi:hypothetical protein